jgi:DNA polymerase-4
METAKQNLPVPDRPRAIIHLDLDAFYASVEVLKNPALEKKPVIVGGRPEERGVVSTASYEARKYGVRSAMPTARALQLCPQAVLLPPRHEVYGDYSRRVMAIVRQASPVVEQVSVDEAYLDVSAQVEAWDDAVDQAREMQRRVVDEVELSASLGVATNKLVAKVASDQHKPGGLTVVRPGEEAAFLAPLPVRVLWGIGPKTAARLAELSVTTVGDLAQVAEEVLRARFGRHGAAMARHAQGMDDRAVVTEREARSISREVTFARDVADRAALEGQLKRSSEGVAAQLKRAGLAAGTVAIKLRYADFFTLTRQMTLAVATDDGDEIYNIALRLLGRVWQPGQRVRLLGVAGRNLGAPTGQLPLWVEEQG